MQKIKRLALIILDGWGHGKEPERSAIALARTPFVDGLYHRLPNAELITHGEEVGLPDGQMGNSEVGHLNIGAGRVVYQELARINKSLREKEFYNNPVFLELISYAKNFNKPIHLIGLLSDGGVHSHIEHAKALCALLKNEPSIRVYIHAFLDGRDTDPMSGAVFLEDIQQHIYGSNATIASIIGRYFAMDRDKRWERVARAYHLLVNGNGMVTDDPIKAVREYYSKNKTDEFMEPIMVVDEGGENRIKNGDAVLFFNFRTDRPRQLSEVLIKTKFEYLDMYPMKLKFCTMTRYDKNLNDIEVLFEKEDLKNTLGEVISRNGLRQVRLAETEKYPHVTFFFSGGREKEFEGETRILVDSPKVATYDLMPEMSALGVTEALISHIKNELPDFICINYANTDMVGHTGVLEAAVKAAETVDACLERLIGVLEENHYNYLIIADHGNADMMINDDGSPNTAHTTNPVPIFAGGSEIHSSTHQLVNGKLADIAPTILSIMGIDMPKEMTGTVLLTKKVN
ncbi:MAG TPA: 2,3-bisphosphoglycerate-independent phosphoglycerate mutase [Saprospiraceae bacterium]|nr:2,3-bisphosphoglycerate-independent phosphoglycerate mutase [Saprospiraceae bacterium]